MVKVNYQLELDKIIEKILLAGDVPTLLLHSCCAPCSSYCLSYLAEYFSITILYYNPNISPKEEYEKRVREQIRLIEELPVRHRVSFVEGRYDPERFDEMARGLEEVPEGGRRCFACYEMRQREAAVYAKEHGFDYFSTTLSVSPHKNAQKLNEIGLLLAKEIQIPYLVSDFKKRGGYQQSIEYSREYHLYRQDYCGCKFSKGRHRNGEKMTEIWDIYDEDGKKTGKTMSRGVPNQGEYMLCVHVYLHTPDGKFLVQKRSQTKESHPGVWDVTGGAVLCGEESFEGAKRETFEEVGIDISDAKVRFIGRIKKKKSFADVYFVEKDFDIKNCVLQKDEVEEVRLVDRGELLDLQMHDRLRDDDYMNVITQALDQM